MRSAAFHPALLGPTILAAGLALAACDPPPPVELGQQGQGGLTQAAVTDDTTPATDDGAAAPSDTASADTAGGAGSLLDAGAGARLAAVLVDDDARYFQQAEIAAQNGPIGSTVTWRNPSSGSVGTVTPLTDLTLGGQDCRQFFMTVTISGRQHSETGTACRTGGGWTTRAG